jgi:outer membrane protein OmpA-like peptidoglycan-associated protein
MKKTTLSAKPLLVMALLAAAAQAPAWATDAQDLGEQVPDAAEVAKGLFPDADCEELKSAGFKCMGFERPKSYSLPGASFRVGSADLPDMLRRQLDVFASVLAGRKGSRAVVRVEGHADASGVPEVNQALSERRAQAVKHYLVGKGADPGMLEAVGMGTKAPKDARDPFAAANRRVEIGRAAARN